MGLGSPSKVAPEAPGAEGDVRPGYWPEPGWETKEQSLSTDAQRVEPGSEGPMRPLPH